MRFTLVAIALLLIPLIAPAAGAIYIEGQQIPDDGQVHIMAAGDQSAVPTLYDGAGEAQPILVTAKVPAIHVPGINLMTGMPSLLNKKYHFGTSGGNPLPMAMPGYWNIMKSMDMTRHMPTFGFPALK